VNPRFFKSEMRALKLGQDMSKVKPVERTTSALQVGSVKQEPFPNIGMHGNLLP
jgi:hypothetical protein